MAGATDVSNLGVVLLTLEIAAVGVLFAFLEYRERRGKVRARRQPSALVFTPIGSEGTVHVHDNNGYWSDDDEDGDG